MSKFLPIIVLFFLPLFAVSQDKDTLIIPDTSGKVVPLQPVKTASPLKKDSTVKKKKYNPRTAAIRSAIMPGLGQIYNKKYWKVSLAYAAVGIPAGFFFDNKKWYDRTKYALAVVANGATNQDSLNKVHVQLRPLVDNKATNSLLRYRNDFRKNMDYSILFMLLGWGLNIVDATVDAHLKGFNVSDDLSFNIKPALLPGNAAGISLVFTLGKNRSNTIPSRF